MSVNASKTNYMILGTTHTTNKYTYGNVDSSDDGRKDIGINTGDDGRTDIGINTGEHTTITQKNKCYIRWCVFGKSEFY